MPRKKKPANETMTGVIYARYSSHAQKDASIEQQVAECTAYAKDHHIRIVDSYEDRAISGRTDKRPSFQRMMKDAEKGKFQCVVAWKSNRMGRNMVQAMVNEARLQEAGVKCRYVEEDFDDSAAGRFALRSMMNVNQFYSENMAEDIKRGMLDNAKQCKLTNGHVPFGYRKSADLHYELDPPKDAIVREIFQRAAAAEPLIDIARDLNERGIKTSTGREWNRGSFHLLENERYTGVYIYDDIRVEGGIPRIVSDELFWRVQEVLKVKRNPRNRGRHRATGEDYLLTGKLFCGYCKSPMSGVSGTSKTGELHHYYICQKRRREHTCNKANVRRDMIETAVARAIQSYALQPEILEWIADKTVAHFEKKLEEAQVSILEEQLAGTKKSIANILKAIEAGVFTPTTKDRLLALEKEQADLEHKIIAARAEVIDIDRETIIEGLGMFRDGNPEDKKYQAALFDTFLLAVYVYDDKLKIVFSFTGDRNKLTIPFHFDVDAAPDSCKSEGDSGAEASASVPGSAPNGEGEKFVLTHLMGTKRVLNEPFANTTIFSIGSVFVLVCSLDAVNN